MLPQDLLNDLVCPVCKTPVIATPSQDALRCPHCRLLYPVRDDIPIMLVDEALPDTDAPVAPKA